MSTGGERTREVYSENNLIRNGRLQLLDSFGQPNVLFAKAHSLVACYKPNLSVTLAWGLDAIRDSKSLGKQLALSHGSHRFPGFIELSFLKLLTVVDTDIRIVVLP